VGSYPLPVSIASILPEIEPLWLQSTGESEVCVAILDGPVDLAHPCFASARLNQEVCSGVAFRLEV